MISVVLIQKHSGWQPAYKEQGSPTCEGVSQLCVIPKANLLTITNFEVCFAFKSSRNVIILFQTDCPYEKLGAFIILGSHILFGFNDLYRIFLLRESPKPFVQGIVIMCLQVPYPKSSRNLSSKTDLHLTRLKVLFLYFIAIENLEFLLIFFVTKVGVGNMDIV